MFTIKVKLQQNVSRNPVINVVVRVEYVHPLALLMAGISSALYALGEPEPALSQSRYNTSCMLVNLNFLSGLFGVLIQQRIDPIQKLYGVCFLLG
jgi:hypothetical protein